MGATVLIPGEYSAGGPASFFTKFWLAFKIFGSPALMSLEEQLLSDYGTIPQRIGLFLLKNNAAVLESIRRAVRLPETELRDGLAILIQRRFVKFFVFEKTIRYYFDRSMLKRRLYFPLYMQYVAKHYSSGHAKCFMEVLTRGIVREAEESAIAEELLRDGLLQLESAHADRASGRCDEPGKARRLSARYLVVAYDFMDQRIFEAETVHYACRRYNEAAGEVLRAVLRCDRVNRASIMKNLESTKILVLENDVIVNDKSNVDEYLEYLARGGILCRGADEGRAYFFDRSTRRLKHYRMSLMLRSPECRRLFNMIAGRGETEDKGIAMHCLLSINKVKEAMLALQRLGLVVQRCADEYKTGHRVEHTWLVDVDSAGKQLSMRIEENIAEKLAQINACWDANYFVGDPDGNEGVWNSDAIGLAMDHLIMGLD